MTTISKEINRPPRPIAPTVTHDTVCHNEQASLSVHLPAAAGTVYWYNTPLGTTHFQYDVFHHTTPPLSNKTTYWVATLSPEGCWSDRVGVTGYVEFPPNVTATLSHTEVAIPNAVVEFQIEDLSQVASVLWDFGDGVASTEMEPVHQYTEEGSFLVTLEVTGHNGCVNRYTLGEVVVTEENALYVPSAFTPNGDGLNDFFQVETVLLTDIEVSIFDRWGKLLYQSQDLRFQWDGKGVDGSELPEGAYAYKIIGTTYGGDKVQKAGTITLLR